MPEVLCATILEHTSTGYMVANPSKSNNHYSRNTYLRIEKIYTLHSD